MGIHKILWDRLNPAERAAAIEWLLERTDDGDLAQAIEHGVKTAEMAIQKRPEGQATDGPRRRGRPRKDAAAPPATTPPATTPSIPDAPITVGGAASNPNPFVTN